MRGRLSIPASQPLPLPASLMAGLYFVGSAIIFTDVCRRKEGFMNATKTLICATILLGANVALGAPPITKDGVTTIHLEEYNGYFAAKETLAPLKAGTYDIVITNKAGKSVGFQIQDAKTHEQFDMFPLEPGETKTSRVEVTTNGFRYRCPINPTPWYVLDNVKE